MNFVCELVSSALTSQSVTCVVQCMQAGLRRRKEYVAIRSLLHGDELDDVDTSPRYSRPVHYMASQYLADSSLNTDVSQFDFATTVTLPKITVVVNRCSCRCY